MEKSRLRSGISKGGRSGCTSASFPLSCLSFVSLPCVMSLVVEYSNLTCGGSIDNTATYPSQRSTRPAQAVRRAKAVVRSNMHSKISRSDRSRSCSTRPISRPNILIVLSYVLLPHYLTRSRSFPLSRSSSCSLCYGVSCNLMDASSTETSGIQPSKATASRDSCRNDS